MRFLVIAVLAMSACGPANVTRDGRAVCEPSGKRFAIEDTAQCGKLCDRTFMTSATGADIRQAVADGARFDVHAGLDTDRVTAMHMAVAMDNLTAVRTLIALGAPLDGDSQGSYTPLHYTALISRRPTPNRFEIARALLDAGADVDPVTAGCETPLYLSLPGSNAFQTPERNPVVRLFVERGARKDRMGPRHRTPYDMYRRSEAPDPEILRLLQ